MYTPVNPKFSKQKWGIWGGGRVHVYNIDNVISADDRNGDTSTSKAKGMPFNLRLSCRLESLLATRENQKGGLFDRQLAMLHGRRTSNYTRFHGKDQVHALLSYFYGTHSNHSVCWCHRRDGGREVQVGQWETYRNSTMAWRRAFCRQNGTMCGHAGER